jgi:hypothetical protein
MSVWTLVYVDVRFVGSFVCSFVRYLSFYLGYVPVVLLWSNVGCRQSVAFSLVYVSARVFLACGVF